ncbi:MAG: flavodoxin family protein [Chloroflexi bacterium]|nr:flavodoxin family protein [Chloroflexota bacterium]
MKILAIAGSPRRGGNTDTLLEQASAGARSMGAEVEQVILNRLKIAPCMACNRCFETGRCAVNDDYQPLYDKTLGADGLILASPIFFMNVSGWTKAFIDRFQCLWALRYVLKQPIPLPPGGKKRRAIFLSTAGSPKTKFDCTLYTVRAFLSTIDAQLVGMQCINAVDEKGAIAAYPEVLQEAYALGVRLASDQEPDTVKEGESA